MTIVRRIIAAAAITGTLAVLPMGVITTTAQAAGGNVVTNGQGSWPLKN